MLYINQELDEMELIVKENENEEPKIFHGPDPRDVPWPDYKEFCRKVEEMADKKSEPET
jgi:hypothetical protein